MDNSTLYKKIEDEFRHLRGCLLEFGSPLDDLNDNIFAMRAELEGRTLDDLFQERDTLEEARLPSSSVLAVKSILYGFLAGSGSLSNFREQYLERLARYIVDEVHRIDELEE